MMQSWTLLLGAPCPSAICGPIFLGSPPARPLLPILQPERLPHHRLRIHSVCWQWKHTPCASDTGSRKVIIFAQRFHASLSKICFLQCVTKPKSWTKPNPKLFFRYQFFSIPNPILLLIPFFFETDTFINTKKIQNQIRNFFSDTNIFRYRIRYFY